MNSNLRQNVRRVEKVLRRLPQLHKLSFYCPNTERRLYDAGCSMFECHRMLRYDDENFIDLTNSITQKIDSLSDV